MVGATEAEAVRAEGEEVVLVTPEVAEEEGVEEAEVVQGNDAVAEHATKEDDNRMAEMKTRN